MATMKVNLAGRPRSPDAEEKICNAAIELVAKIGYADTTIEKIAEKAKVAKTTIYRRWVSKAAMMVSVYERFVQPEIQIIGELSFREEMSQILHAVFAIYHKTSADIILGGLIAEAQNNPDTMTALKCGVIQQRRDILTNVISRAIQSNELSASLNEQDISDLIVAMIWHRLLTNRQHLNSAFIETMINYVMAIGNPE